MSAPLSLPGLTQFLSRLEDYPRLLEAVDQGKQTIALSGLSAVHRAYLAAALHQSTGRPLTLVCPDDGEARRLAGDLSALTGAEVPVLPARDFLFHPGAASRQWEHQRLEILARLHRGDCPVLVATVEGLLQRTMPPAVFAASCRQLHVGQVCQPEGLTDFLVRAGYTRCDQVEGTGQFALRGGILDVFSPGLDLPVRMEFWGDEIVSMGLFDPATQRRTAQRETCTLLPAGEVLLPQDDPWTGPPDLALGRVYDQLTTPAGYLPGNALVGLCDTPRVAERAKNYLWQLGQDITALLEQGLLTGKPPVLAPAFEALCAGLAPRTLLYLDAFPTGAPPVPPAALLSFTARQLSGYGIRFASVTEDLLQFQKDDFAVVLLASSRRKADALQAMLREKRVFSAVDERLHDLPAPGRITIAVGGLSAGFDFPDGKFAVLAEGEALPARSPRTRRPKADPTTRQRLESFTDLAPGDLVVHEHHGIGRYVGMVKMTADGVQKDYVKINYAGADVLYVPATQLDLVSKYIGAGENVEAKKLSKLGGADWEKAKTRAKKAVADLAKGLIQLYAERQRLPGYAFSPDSPWQKEFEDQFEYTETDDQLRCIAEIKRDMEKATPMDRLLCGDVGYGKTEVAFRAIMKCVLDGKQAAILAPTTVLARQHYLTAKRRFAKFPVEIDVVSRFRTAGQMRATLQKLQAGKLDLLIGTHRLFQKDVKFKDLGLLVVDEEQRFGVAHKEKLKELSKQVDVLTLSATPIPRTLNMALSGIRDMSTLEEPPQDRLPVQTYVLEHDWGVLADAMKRELERGGQVYYLHNRVETIERTAARIQALLPEARIGVGHGKMTQEELSDVMSHMTDGDLDILVCTTIIETGIDIPNANTLIIEDADHLGLAQLHQIRGRVGRSARRASAYMTYRRGKVLTEVAAKRLGAIREFAEFGSGFKIAMRDLEIRGAGNVLGPEQSGFLLSVGYDMYLKLLEEAVLEERGEKPELRAECAADLTVAASIPDRYVPSPEQRMDLYRRIAHIRSEEEADDLVDELVDRYGDPPRPVNNLISVALLRAAAAKCGVTEIAQRGERLNFTLRDPDLARVSAIAGRPAYRGRLLFSAGDKPYLSLKVKKGEDPVKLSSKLIEEYGAAAP